MRQILTFIVFTVMLFEGNVSKKQILIVSVYMANVFFNESNKRHLDDKGVITTLTSIS